MWRFPEHVPGQDYSKSALRNCVAIADDGSTYACIGSRLYCLSVEKDKPRIRWQYETGSHIPGCPVLGADGRVRVHSSDGCLHGVDASGAAAWAPLDVREPLGWANPLVDSNGNTWICNYAGGLSRVTAQGITHKMPFFRSRQKFDSTGLIRKGTLHVGAEDAFVYAIDLTGNRGRNVWDHLAGRGQTEWFINSAPAWHPQDLLIVAGRDEFLYAFEEDGATRWKLHIRGQMLASPVVSEGGDVLVGVSLLQRGRDDAGKLVCVDPDTRKVKWEYEAQGPVESTPVIGADGVAYFGDNAGWIHAVALNGQRRWICQVGVPVRSAGAILGSGRVNFGLDDGTIVTLACSSESLARGGWPKFLGSRCHFFRE